MKELVLGVGHYRKKRIFYGGNIEYNNPVFVDIDPNCKPNLIYDLNKLHIIAERLPFDDNEFDEIHAYDVLEHVGKQGDEVGFFREFSEYYRVIKPNGRFYISAPDYDSKWAWGDPGHKRIITRETFVFLSQEVYKLQIGNTQMSDYRYLWQGDFILIDYIPGGGNESNSYILKAIK